MWFATREVAWRVICTNALSSYTRTSWSQLDPSRDEVFTTRTDVSRGQALWFAKNQTYVYSMTGIIRHVKKTR